MSVEPDHLTIAGRVADLFGHRFVLATADGKILADLGPHGLDHVTLAAGDDVTLTGERKPSEVRVHSLTLAGRIVILNAGKEAGSAERALAAVEAAGYEPIGEAKRKPKHFEILARCGDAYAEFHVELDGAVRKMRSVKAPKPGDVL